MGEAGDRKFARVDVKYKLAGFILGAEAAAWICRGKGDAMDDETEGTAPRNKKIKVHNNELKPRASKKRPHALKGTSSGKKLPWTFPKNTLEEAIKIPKVIEEKNAGKPIPARDLVGLVGFRQTNDWRFLDLARSANQYGIVKWTGAAAPISMTELGENIVAPSSPSQRSTALLAAFRNVKAFADVEEYYGQKHIPEDEFFSNTLTREFKVPRDRVETFAKVFKENLKFLRSFTASPTPAETAATSGDIVGSPRPPDKITVIAGIPREARVREFLDTCFVMMPFGAWPDRYYQEIYVPAIKEAGFEPIRADE